MLAVIPARGGSKGLPGKNVKKLAGKPLIAYTIEAALSSKEVTQIVISTDDEEIANVCSKYDVEIPFMRPEVLASDNALIVDTYTYTVDRINKEQNKNYQNMIALLPTCPLRNGNDIDSAVKIFKEKEADSVISYYEAPHPVQWYRYIDNNGVLRSVFQESDRLANRQEENITYLPNGAIYVFKMNLLRENKYYSDKSYPYLMPSSRSIDIDTLNDFKMAECALKDGVV